MDEAGRILLCSEGMARLMGFEAPPCGMLAAELPVVKRGRDADFWSRTVAEALSRTGHSFVQKLEAFGGEASYELLRLCLTTEKGLVRLCLVHDPDEAPASDCDAERKQDRDLWLQLRQLARKNASLRMLSAERNAVAQALRRAESRYRDIFDNATEGIFQWTPEGRLVSANRAFARMLGYGTVNELMQSLVDTPFHFCFSPGVEQILMTELERKNQVTGYEFQAARQDGTSLWATMNVRRVSTPEGGIKYYEAFIEDISGRKAVEEKLMHQAFHDSLTGLANRALFLDRLHMALRRAARQPRYSFAVLNLDLDRFKIVNDCFGHATGDELLCHTAQCLLSSVREMDTVARFGGDEFALIIENGGRPSLAVRVAKRIHEALSSPFVVNGQKVSVGVSVGIVLKAERYEHVEDILRDADTAMYRAKADRGVFYKVFTQKMRAETTQSIIFEAELRHAVQAKEFQLHYQPIVNMQNGELFGFEALLRWYRKGELIGPSRFLEVAEESGVIRMLGLQAIESVCKQLVVWNRRFGNAFVMHVNISSRQLLFPNFAKDVKRILQKTGANPALLVFEITESALLDKTESSMMGLQEVRKLGIRLCLDDFGVGFSSLSYLRQLPLSSIKMDRSFVSDIEADSQSRIIVRNLVSLGKEMGIDVVVEGVERQTQAQALMEAGCSLGQGYYFDRPMSAIEVERSVFSQMESH